MMSYTRLYVDATADLMIQARKKSLQILLYQWLENIRGNNSFIIIIEPKDNTHSFKKAETSIKRGRKLDMKDIFQHYMLS